MASPERKSSSDSHLLYCPVVKGDKELKYQTFLRRWFQIVDAVAALQQKYKNRDVSQYLSTIYVYK
jgi:hypothetical protein